MRKLNLLFAIVILVTALQFSSCSNADIKSKQEKEVSNDSVNTKKNMEPGTRPADEKPPANSGSGTTGIIPPKPSKDDILANIDLYLVSTATIPTQTSEGGIQNATVSVKNTLTDVTIQKAIVEVSILTTEGAEFRTDYYVLQNVEPGETEMIKIPKASRGNSIVSHIVKLKSQELTNGEMILVGHRVTPK